MMNSGNKIIIDHMKLGTDGPSVRIQDQIHCNMEKKASHKLIAG